MINVVHMTLVYWTILCFSHVRNRTNLFNHHNRPPLVCTSKISHPHSVTSFEKLQGRQCKSWLCFCLVCFWHTFDFKLGHNTPSIVRKEWPIINSHGAMFAVPRGVVQYVKRKFDNRWGKEYHHRYSYAWFALTFAPYARTGHLTLGDMAPLENV